MDDYDVCDCLWRNGNIEVPSMDCAAHNKLVKSASVVSRHVGFGNKERIVIADVNLGYGAFRAWKPGFRMAFWDLCYGYVSGFRMRDILWYIATRSFKK